MARKYDRAIEPWESSPEIFTSAAHSLGLSEEFYFVDVLDLEGKLPQGTVALVLAYTTPDDYESQQELNATQARGIAWNGESFNVVWLSQKVQNACGPYALFHATFNSIGRDHVGMSDGLLVLVPNADEWEAKGSYLHRTREILMEATSQEEQSVKLQNFFELWEKCEEIGKLGDSTPPENAEADVEPHFVCFTGMSGWLAMFDSDSTSGPEGLDVQLSPSGMLPDLALHAVTKHLMSHAHEDRHHLSSLLALVHDTDEKND